MIELKSERLLIRDIGEEDLKEFLDVYLSNPDFVQTMEGSKGRSGYYDLEMFQRDWHIAQMTPERHMLGISLINEQIPIGLIDYLGENPSDGYLWLGLIMIHNDYQHRGYGKEAFCRLVKHFDAIGKELIRIGLRDQVHDLDFAKKLGFKEVSNSSKLLIQNNLCVMELRI
ncbi:GNAT family N-acetyltransferase [Scopulibacillus cellulosilyticus]|uniref:GNAT family N-acetyltransferase n=1 Tax=Scopulibacillus cellulosilyticus TaxID=2665665 RepID=A0ABW2PXE1_9BACL